MTDKPIPKEKLYNKWDLLEIILKSGGNVCSACKTNNCNDDPKSSDYCEVYQDEYSRFEPKSWKD